MQTLACLAVINRVMYSMTYIMCLPQPRYQVRDVKFMPKQPFVYTQVAVVRPTCLLEDDVNPPVRQTEQQALTDQGQVLYVAISLNLLNCSVL